MRIITLRPKWAHAICHEGKDVENRSWRPDLEASDLLGIHAGRAKTQEESRLYKCCAIVAIAMVGEPVRDYPSPWSLPNCWHIPIVDLQILDKPIECPGRLGIWYHKVSR